MQRLKTLNAIKIWCDKSKLQSKYKYLETKYDKLQKICCQVISPKHPQLYEGVFGIGIICSLGIS